MQQFQVPQFLGRPSQLLGPFTVKQTIIVSISGAILVLFWNILEVWFFFLVAPAVVIVTLIIIFMRINGRPMLDFVGAIFSYFVSPQVFIWEKREYKKISKPSGGAETTLEVFAGEASTTTSQGIRELAKRIDKY